MPTLNKAMIKALALSLALTAAFAAGRYSVPKDVSKSQTEETDSNKHKETEVITVKQPDGSVKIIKRIVEDSSSSTTKSKQSEVKNIKKSLNISALVSNNIREPLNPIYGVSVTKEVLGPLTLGAFGLTNGTIGLSLGVNF